MVGRLVVAGIVLVGFTGVSAPVHAQGVAGTYVVEFPTRIRNVNGEEVVEQMGHARVTFQVKGDSITGTWASLDRPEAKPRELRGTVQGATLRFSTDPTEGRMNMNGEERTVQMFTDYTATVTGDEIKGTLKAHSADGAIQTGERKWSGKRDK